MDAGFAVILMRALFFNFAYQSGKFQILLLKKCLCNLFWLQGYL